MALAMSFTLADQAFLDPGQPRQEVTPIQLQEVTDMALFPGFAVDEFVDLTKDTGLDGSFGCGIGTEFRGRDYYTIDCVIRVVLCSTVKWDDRVEKSMWDADP
jgi:hypothetical protein